MIAMSKLVFACLASACYGHKARTSTWDTGSVKELATLLLAMQPSSHIGGMSGSRPSVAMQYNGGPTNWKPSWKDAYAPAGGGGKQVFADAGEQKVVADAGEKPAPAEKKPTKRKPTATGLFAPAVVAAKDVMGAKELNKLRADIIKKHTKVISSFVDTSESKFGQIVLKRMFDAADKDDSGTLDREEIKEALAALGFDFLTEKDMDKVMKKADMDGNEVIDFEEFIKETPRVLRMNLVQLAKANGHDLGFLA